MGLAKVTFWCNGYLKFVGPFGQWKNGPTDLILFRGKMKSKVPTPPPPKCFSVKPRLAHFCVFSRKKAASPNMRKFQCRELTKIPMPFMHKYSYTNVWSCLFPRENNIETKGVE